MNKNITNYVVWTSERHYILQQKIVLEDLGDLPRYPSPNKATAVKKKNFIERSQNNLNKNSGTVGTSFVFFVYVYVPDQVMKLVQLSMGHSSYRTNKDTALKSLTMSGCKLGLTRWWTELWKNTTRKSEVCIQKSVQHSKRDYISYHCMLMMSSFIIAIFSEFMIRTCHLPANPTNVVPLAESEFT